MIPMEPSVFLPDAGDLQVEDQFAVTEQGHRVPAPGTARE